MLLEIKAVHFNAAEPFTLASGLPSPTYIDCRKLISYPRIRARLMDFLSVTVMRDAGFEAFDNIAGAGNRGHSVCRIGGRAHGAAHDLCAQKAQRLRPQRPH
jgi:orotate phosphoribosyltransferase